MTADLVSRATKALALMAGIAAFATPAAAAPACQDIPDPFVSAVPPPTRPQAFRQLHTVDIVALTDAQAAALLNEPTGPLPLARRHLNRAIADLKHQRREEMVFQRGGWSQEDEADLTALTHLPAASVARLRPFLVRAVIGFEGTGHFGAQLCGDELDITHDSLGHSTPKPTPGAVIVFLPTPPRLIKADISVAE